MKHTLLTKSGVRRSLITGSVIMAASCAGLLYAGNSSSVSGVIKSHNTGTICSEKLLSAGLDRASINTKRNVSPEVNSTVRAETIIDENFDKWTKGTQEQPSSEQVTDDMAAQLMSYQGEWILFDMYEAGGAGYMGFDEVSDDGPGYIKTPKLNLKGEDPQGIYRYTVSVKNVNTDAQDQALQTFVMDEAASSIVTASTQPMKYGEWAECEWIGATKSESITFMSFGWKGKVLIDRLKVEKLIYPLSTPNVTSAKLDTDGSIKVEWEKVEGATSYKVVISGNEYESMLTVGDVNVCNIPLDVFDPKATYVAYVTAYDGEKLSYPGYVTCDMEPEQVGTAVALEATEVSANGFTANWEAAAFAANYLILPTLTHTATKTETFYILDEKMAFVPETADLNNPIMVSPILNMGGADIYWSRAGWTFDLAVFANMMPGMPVALLSNQYKAYGITGSITSPVTDFSVGGGKVTISGFGASAADDTVMECSFINASGEVYASTSFELTTTPSDFSVELEGGKADSRLCISMGETAGEEQIYFTALNISTELEAGETVTVPAETVHIDENVTSGRVECTVDDNNSYSYRVQGYWSANIMGEPSNSIVVGNPSSLKSVESNGSAYAVATADGIFIANPAGNDCEVFTLDGKLVYSSASGSAHVALDKGIYLVKIGKKVFKISK